MSSSEFLDEKFMGCKEKEDSGRDKGCDCESARALKKIISLLDELNNQDLCLLDEIIDRILCERKH